MTREFDCHKTVNVIAVGSGMRRYTLAEHFAVYRQPRPNGQVEYVEYRTFCELPDGKIAHHIGEDEFVVRDTGERLRRTI